MAGYLYSSTSGTDSCFALGSVTAAHGSDGQAGGLVGYGNYTNIKYSYSAGRVTGSGSNVGGLIGYQYGGTITSSYFDSTITGGITPATQARTTS